MSSESLLSSVLRCVPILLALACAPAHAQTIIEFEEDTEVDWIQAVEDFVTIPFTGFPLGTIITPQYADLGVVFTDGDDVVLGPSPNTYVNDEWGLRSLFTDIEMTFDSPQNAIAVDHPGNVTIHLFDEGELFSSHGFFNSGIGFFSGVISSRPFDAVILEDEDGFVVTIDDLHFGSFAPNVGDVNADGLVDVLDVLEVIANWGACPDKGTCPADTNDNGTVNVADLMTVIMQWS